MWTDKSKLSQCKLSLTNLPSIWRLSGRSHDFKLDPRQHCLYTLTRQFDVVWDYCYLSCQEKKRQSILLPVRVAALRDDGLWQPY